MVEKLESCPNCNESNYKFACEYGLDSKSLVKDAAKLALNPVKTYMSVAKKVYQGVVKDLDGYPMLQCKNCGNLVVCCVHCEQYSILPKIPKIDELVRCVKCKKKYQATRFSLAWSKLLSL